MGYEDNKTRASCPVGAAAGVGRVPPPFPRAFQPLRGAAVAGALPNRLVDQAVPHGGGFCPGSRRLSKMRGFGGPPLCRITSPELSDPPMLTNSSPQGQT